MKVLVGLRHDETLRSVRDPDIRESGERHDAKPVLRGSFPPAQEPRHADARTKVQVPECKMLASFLMGIVGGQRGVTPIATVAVAAARGELPADNGAPRIIAHPLVAAGLLALAAAEYAGDKQKTAPDRIVPIGLAVRFITSAIAGAALTSRRDRWVGAAIGGITAVAASYPGWRLRTATMPRYGQTLTGFAEEAVVLAGAVAIVRANDRPRS